MIHQIWAPSWDLVCHLVQNLFWSHRCVSPGGQWRGTRAGGRHEWKHAPLSHSVVLQKPTTALTLSSTADVWWGRRTKPKADSSVGSSGPTSGISSWVWDLEHQACREWWRCLRSTAVRSARWPRAGRALQRQRSRRVNKQFTGSIIRTQSWTAKTQMYKVDLKVSAEPVLCYWPLERSGWRSPRCPQLQDAASFLFFLKQKNITQVKTSRTNEHLTGS